MLDNVAARRTYERNGFTLSREAGDPLPGGRRELVMLRDLGPERTAGD
jgi:ribosomal protein S18 acetylase RimI-like enzyme